MGRTSAEFLGLEQVGDRRWRLPVSAHITGGGRQSLFGGAGLAAGVAILEVVTERPAVWATGQYLSVTGPGDIIDLDVMTPAVGRTVTQGRVIGHVGENEIITIIGAVGRRPENEAGVWPTMPDVGDPDDAVEVVRDPEPDDVMHNHVETRMAKGMFGFVVGGGEPSGDEQTLMWLRMRDVDLDPAALALLGDYMPAALGNALGHVMFCTSLDNTIRFGQTIEPDNDGWVLCDSRMEFVGNGFAHGTGLMWSRSGRLLATVSQSMLVVTPPPELT